MRFSIILALILSMASFYGCIGASNQPTNETAVQKYLLVYDASIANGKNYTESGNYDQAQAFYNRARIALSDSLIQLDAGCKADIYPKDYCEAENRDIRDCKMEVATFYENYNKMAQWQNPELNCNATITSFNNANMRCSLIYEDYRSILGTWKNITPPSKLKSMCNLTEG